MSPNNYSITETSTNSDKESYERSHSEMSILNVS